MKKRLIAFVSLLALILIAFTGLNLSAAPSPEVLAKIAPQLQAEWEDKGRTEFFVILAEEADLSRAGRLNTKVERGTYVYQTLWQTAQTGQTPLKAWLEGRGIAYRSFYIVNALLVEGDQNLALSLAARADVARLEANPKIYNLPEPALVDGLRPKTNGLESNLTYVNADDVWNLGFSGQEIVVGGQDTGYDWDHPALKSQYRGWDGSSADHNYNWHDSIHTNTHGFNPCGVDSPQPCDDHDHGTHTMGTAVGDDGGANQIGMAPGAKWIGCRNMDNGWGTPASYLECLEFFLAPYPVGGSPAEGQPDLAPDVTINSWTCPPVEGCNWDTLQTAVEAQRAAGIVTVAAAGNSSSSCGSIGEPPGIYDAAYTVGALQKGSDTLASFSSRGPVTVDGSNRLKPDIAAPGTSIRSSIPGGGYGSMGGTSMATPHVAGAVALLWSAVPELRHDIPTTENYLNETAVHISASACDSSGWPNNLYGYGRLDILAAVQQALIDFDRVLPSAAFTHTVPVSINQTVVFTNLSSGSLPLTSTWRFDDGTPDLTTGTALLPVQHTFTTGGNHSVSLTVSNPFGQSTVTKTVTVYSPAQPTPPKAAFTHTLPVYRNQSVVFVNLTTGTYPITYTWDFGDDTTETVYPGTAFFFVEHTYTATGTYTVTLTATNAYGESVFTTTLTVYQAGLRLGPTTATQSGRHDVPLTYTLYLTNTGDLPDSFQLVVGGWYTAVSLSPPQAALLPLEDAPIIIVVPFPPAETPPLQLTTVVTAASLGDPEQVAAVTLHSLFTPAPDETLPTAAFTYSQPVYVNQTVVFTNLTTGAPPITSTWHFGDETGRFDAGTALIPVQHTYPGPGVYTVFLTATNSFGQSIFTDTISVDWAAKVYLPLVLKE